jgi:hypothetical protein
MTDKTICCLCGIKLGKGFIDEPFELNGNLFCMVHYFEVKKGIRKAPKHKKMHNYYQEW